MSAVTGKGGVFSGGGVAGNCDKENGGIDENETEIRRL